jgi:hypothetical protein
MMIGYQEKYDKQQCGCQQKDTSYPDYLFLGKEKVHIEKF